MLYSMINIINESGYSDSTVRNYIKILGIEPCAVESSNKALYSEKDAHRIIEYIAINANAKYKIRQKKICEICGITGHSEARCSESKKPRECPECNAVLNVSDFRVINRTSANGVIHKYLTRKCRECDRGAHKNNVRTKLTVRLGQMRSAAKRRSKKQNMDYDLEPTSLLEIYNKQQGKCYYTGIPLMLEKGNYTMSIDRIDSEMGYTVGNIVICCWVVNHMKKDMPVSEFVDICAKVASAGL